MKVLRVCSMKISRATQGESTILIRILILPRTPFVNSHDVKSVFNNIQQFPLRNVATCVWSLGDELTSDKFLFKFQTRWLMWEFLPSRPFERNFQTPSRVTLNRVEWNVGLCSSKIIQEEELNVPGIQSIPSFAPESDSHILPLRKSCGIAELSGHPQSSRKGKICFQRILNVQDQACPQIHEQPQSNDCIQNIG
jgi:hypothetical protein